MVREEHRFPNPSTLGGWFVLVIACLTLAYGESSGQDSPDASPIASRFDQLEQTLHAVVEENNRLAAEVDVLKQQSNFYLQEEPTSSNSIAPPIASQTDFNKRFQTAYTTGYDNGFFLRPDNAEESPFSLKINNQNTFRYTGFSRDETSWTDSSGNVNPIFNSSNVMIPRGRLIFSGNAFLPGISYLLNIDYNTVSNTPVGFRAYVLSYKFGRACEVHVGQNKVPGTREWLTSSWDAQEGPDRSMATTFFRPSLSQGIWFTGEPLDGVHYHAMVSNGFNTINLRPNQLDNRICCSESVWWEPWGEFGRGYSDIQNHEEPAVRLGTSLTNTKEEGSQSSDYPENASVRLSDGTLLIQEGALAPGVTIQEFTLSLVALDLAFKHRGFSASTEIYLQELSSLQGNGPLPISSVRARGGVVQGGYFIIPQRVELYSRYSFVTGSYGSGSEVGGGVNWFILPGKSNLRFTFDAAGLDSSPADQNRTGFVAGQTGVLFRTQINSSF